MTVTTPTGTYPGWLQVTDKEIRVQPRSGSAKAVPDARVEGSHMVFAITPAMSWDLTAKGDEITGTLKRGEETAGRIAGVRAPSLKRSAPKAWTKPEPLFNGQDLTGWEPDRPEANHWVARDGVLVNETKGANLRTTRKFDDFKLHIEFNSPENANSGIYLRGRYEVQLEYEPAGTEDAYHSMGAIYGAVAAKGTIPRTPNQWETFDIMLVGRNVTVARNGFTIIDNQEIPGITGGALDSREGEPGVFYIQGDHTGGIKFRNITVSVPRH